MVLSTSIVGTELYEDEGGVDDRRNSISKDTVVKATGFESHLLCGAGVGPISRWHQVEGSRTCSAYGCFRTFLSTSPAYFWDESLKRVCEFQAKRDPNVYCTVFVNGVELVVADVYMGYQWILRSSSPPLVSITLPSPDLCDKKKTHQRPFRPVQSKGWCPFGICGEV